MTRGYQTHNENSPTGSFAAWKSAVSTAAYLSLATAVPFVEVSGQSMLQVATTSSFAPGSQDLFVVDLASARAGTVPPGIQLLSGAPSVVIKDGRPMLRATSPSEFLITLPSVLPQNFTIEADIIPKDGGPDPDLTLEGTRVINQDGASAHLGLLGDASFGFIQVVGGSTNIPEFPIPDQIRVTLPENFTRVGVSVAGTTIRFYINGMEIVPDPAQPAQTVQAQFARGNVLRVTLGGHTDPDGTVRPAYLSRVRIATGAPATLVTTVSPQTATMIPVAPAVTPHVGPQGDASVVWTPVAGATSYFVVRWKTDDAACCKNFSPPGGMNTLTWQDGLLPVAGPYAYRVYATTASGVSISEATFNYAPATPTVLQLQISSRWPWGAILTWSPVAGAARYQIERGDGGKPLGIRATILAGSPEFAGATLGDPYLINNTQYVYRVVAQDQTGKVLLASGTQSIATPSQYPAVNNVSATVGPLQNLILNVNDPTPKPAHSVTWNWDPVPSMAAQVASFVLTSTDPATGQTKTVRDPVGSTWWSPGQSRAIAPATSVRFCVAVIPDPERVGELAGPTCVSTTVPGQSTTSISGAPAFPASRTVSLSQFSASGSTTSGTSGAQTFPASRTVNLSQVSASGGTTSSTTGAQTSAPASRTIALPAWTASGPRPPETIPSVISYNGLLHVLPKVPRFPK